MVLRRTLASLAAFVIATSVASAGHFYGIDSGDPAIDVINGVLTGNGTVTGVLPASAPQPNEGFDYVVFHANAGDIVTVDMIGVRHLGRYPTERALEDFEWGLDEDSWLLSTPLSGNVSKFRPSFSSPLR